MAVGSLVLGLICLVVVRRPELRDSAEIPHVAGAFGTATTFLLSLAVMLVFPASSYWPLLLLLVSDRLVKLGSAVVERVSG